jgi:hypothetical protein
MTDHARRNGKRNGKLRDDLLRQSDEMRNKLVRTVARIDERRHDTFDVRKQINRHLKQVAIAAGLILVGTSGVVAFAVYRVMSASQRRQGARWRLAKDAWSHPQRELRARRSSFAVEVLRSLAFTALTTLLAAPIRRAVRGTR